MPCLQTGAHKGTLPGSDALERDAGAGRGGSKASHSGRALGVGALRTLPLWLTVILLLITRIEPIKVRDLIQREDPHFSIYFGDLFTFRLSAALVVSVVDIFGLGEETLDWSYELLYVPFLGAHRVLVRVSACIPKQRACVLLVTLQVTACR